jgi:hypothetical protein
MTRKPIALNESTYTDLFSIICDITCRVLCPKHHPLPSPIRYTSKEARAVALDVMSALEDYGIIRAKA